jgi:hypothetical protein
MPDQDQQRARLGLASKRAPRPPLLRVHCAPALHNSNAPPRLLLGGADHVPALPVTQPPILRLKLCRHEKNTNRPFGVVYGTDVLPETSRCRGCCRLQRTWLLWPRPLLGTRADTPIMHILIGIAGSGRAVTGAIGRARRDEGPAAREAKFYRNFVTSN